MPSSKLSDPSADLVRRLVEHALSQVDSKTCTTPLPTDLSELNVAAFRDGTSSREQSVAVDALKKFGRKFEKTQKSP